MDESSSTSISSHHAGIQAHLFPAFSSSDAPHRQQQPYHGSANAGRSSRRTQRGGRLQKTKMKAHKLRNKLHEWEHKIEEETRFRPALSLPRAMPDMRFEQSYLATVRGFVHELPSQQSAQEKQAVLEARAHDDNVAFHEKESTANAEDTPNIVATLSRTQEPELWVGSLKIDWRPLLWVTIRDQVVSPLVQGTIWGLAGLVIAGTRALIIDQRRLARDTHPARSSSCKGGQTSSPSRSANPFRSLLSAIGLPRK